MDGTLLPPGDGFPAPQHIGGGDGYLHIVSIVAEQVPQVDTAGICAGGQKIQLFVLDTPVGGRQNSAHRGFPLPEILL